VILKLKYRYRCFRIASGKKRVHHFIYIYLKEFHIPSSNEVFKSWLKWSSTVTKMKSQFVYL